MNAFSKIFTVALLSLIGTVSCAAQSTDGLKTLIVVFDGLREDYITPELMPNLYALGKEGAIGKQNHSVFPTVTRVNAPSIATGTYPYQHGILGNSISIPGLSNFGVINTGNATELIEASDALSGSLLTSISLGELLRVQGKKMMVFSSGSTGQAFLQNHKINNGAIINPELILPSSFKDEVIRVVGTPESYGSGNAAKHEWIVKAFSTFVLTPEGPEVSTIWFSDPDATAHEYGIGASQTLASLNVVDQQLGKVLLEMENKKMRDKYNIIVTTDHGFVTHRGEENLTEFLLKKGLKKTKDSNDIVVAGGAIFVKEHDPDVIQKIVASLQQQDWVGAIFTKASSQKPTLGWVDGTLSFDAIQWGHSARASDILVDVNWNDQKNEFGYQGVSFAGGMAGHGSSSPYEIHIPLIMHGPSFKQGFESTLPTANVDIAPTVLYLQDIPVPKTMDGRIMNEFLLGNPVHNKKEVQKNRIETKAVHSWGKYTLTLQQSVFDNHTYLDFTKVERKLNPSVLSK